MGKPVDGTLADMYLRQRGVLHAARQTSLRFHPSCYYRDLATGAGSAFPALIAAVTDGRGVITGVHRTYLAPSRLNAEGTGKAPVDNPRRALGSLLGNAVRFGFRPDGPVPVMAAGEGLETMLSLAEAMPTMPMAAALSISHLAAFRFPPDCLRLYIAADADAAGRHAIDRLSRRAQDAGVLPLVISPELGDFNEDLRRLGPGRLTKRLRDQLVPEDVAALLPP